MRIGTLIEGRPRGTTETATLAGTVGEGRGVNEGVAVGVMPWV